jgi:hypothetical protein
LQHIRSKIKKCDESRPTNNAWCTTFWDENQEELPRDFWPEQWVGQEVRAVVVASSIWLANGRWGLTLSASNLQVRPINRPPELPLAFPFEKEEEERT